MKHDSPEQKFYLNQHKVEMASRGEMLNFNTDIKVIYNNLFSHGKRYHIIEEVLDILSVNLTLYPTRSPTLVCNSSDILVATDRAAILLG